MARKLIVEILGDASSLEKSYARAERSTKQFGQTIDRAGRSSLTASVGFKGLGRSVAGLSAAFLGGAGLIAGLKGAVSAASNLAEQTAKTEVVFGDNASAVEEWAKTTVDSMGLAQDQALETASSFGALLRPLGLTGSEAAKQSLALTQLGADLASFYNTSVQDALDAIRSGLVGEVEPLRRYGALLSEARVQQVALQQTGKKHADQLTQQEKVLARVSILFHDTAQAQGDFARTGEGLANQQRKLQANLRQLQITLGQALIPDVRRIVRSLNEWLSNTENQRRVTHALREAVSILRDVLLKLKAVFDALNDVMGSTRSTLRLLFAAFIAFKTVELAARLTGIAEALGLIGINAGKARTGLLTLRNIPSLWTLGVAGALAVASSGEVAGKPTGPMQVSGGVGDLVTYRDPVTGKYVMTQKRAGETDAQAAKRDFDRRHPSYVAPTAAGSSTADRQPGRSPQGPGSFQPIVVPTPTPRRTGTGAFSGASNLLFDQRIARLIDRSQDSTIRQQIARLGQVADLIRQRIAASRAVTRRLELEDRLLDVFRRQRELKAQLVAAFIDALEFNVEKAGATKTLSDDLRALRKLEAALVERVRIEGRTLDLQRRLLAVRQQIADVRKQQAQDAADARQARQFKALGLGPTGEELAPGVAALKKHLGSVEDLVKGTFLDTKKMRSVFSTITRLLSGALGKVGDDVRRAIDAILDDVDEQLKDRQVDRTKFRKTSADWLVAALGLDPEQARRFRQVWATLGPNMTRPSPSAQYAGAGAGITINGPVHVHGVQNVADWENVLTKRARQRPHVRRGSR